MRNYTRFPLVINTLSIIYLGSARSIAFVVRRFAWDGRDLALEESEKIFRLQWVTLLAKAIENGEMDEELASFQQFQPHA
jgi:hypothetical protein